MGQNILPCVIRKKKTSSPMTIPKPGYPFKKLDLT